MAPQERPPQPDRNPEDERHKWQMETEERLASLVSDFGFDPDIAAAYTPEAATLYVYPGMDSAFGEQLEQLQANSVRQLHALCTDAYDQRFTNRKVQRGVAGLRHQLGAYGPDGDARMTAELVKRTGTEASAAWALATGHVGLLRRGLHSAVVQATYLHYFFELGGVNLPLDEADDTFAFFKDFAFGPDIPSDELGLRDVAVRLRLLDVVDLSREHLDARLAHHAAVVQLETAQILLTSLETFARLKPSDGPQRAAAIAERYADALMGYDIKGKAESARSVADLFRTYRRQLHDRRSRVVLEVYARDAAEVAETLPAAAGMLALVYEDRGFTLPPLLQYLAEQDASADQPADSDIAAGSLAIRRELQTEAAELTVRAEAFSQPWRLSARERRQQGFDGMQRALVIGFTDALGQPVLDAIPKGQATQVIGVLASLDSLIRDGPEVEAATRLDAVLSEEQSLRERTVELQTTARMVGVPMGSVAIESVGEVVALLRTNWPGYRALMIETWPKQQGREVARRLELLFGERQ